MQGLQVDINAPFYCKALKLKTSVKKHIQTILQHQMQSHTSL